MKRYKSLFNEELTDQEREKLEKEYDEISQRIKKEPFIDPRDMRRKDEILSLLMTDGDSDEVRIKPGKMKKSKRVTPFNRTRS